MLTNKGYYIPKYLYKRKVAAVREKILMRKYGYLFYRRTICNLLPSQAKTYYITKLKKQCFTKWVYHWYQERKEWKYLVRAGVHYSLNLMYKTLFRWKLFCLHQKEMKLKEQIAVLHYSKHYKKVTLTLALTRWKFYIRYKSYRRELSQIAKHFFKTKHSIEMVRDYWNRWRLFTKWSNKRKNQMQLAHNLNIRKLKLHSLRALKTNVSVQKHKKELITVATRFYETRLKQRILTYLKTFTEEQLRLKQSMLLAETHYTYKLKSNSLKKFLQYKERRQMIKRKLLDIEILQRKRILEQYFIRLQIFHQQQRLKKQNNICASKFYNISLLGRCFRIWRNYRQYKIEKIVLYNILLEKTINHLNLYKKKQIFIRWQKYICHKRNKKLKYSNADGFNKKVCLRNYLNKWLFYVEYKRLKKHNMLRATDFADEKLLKMSFKIWKKYVDEEILFKTNLERARGYYKQQLLVEGLHLIITHGLKKKEENVGECIKNFSKQIMLAQKYMSIWKQKVLYKNVKHNIFEDDRENIVLFPDWYPVCFLTPRIPNSYFTNH